MGNNIYIIRLIKKPRGKVNEEYYCENGLKNGKWKQYFKLGAVKSEGIIKWVKKGVFIYYFSNAP